MTNEMFRAESASDMRRLTVSVAFVAFAICPALPRCRNVRMGRGRCGCAHPFHTCNRCRGRPRLHGAPTSVVNC